MKKLITVLSILSLIACSDTNDVKYEVKSIGDYTTPLPAGYHNFKSSLSVIVIDSCEYIGYLQRLNHDILTHKGNCRFCEARKNKK